MERERENTNETKNILDVFARHISFYYVKWQHLLLINLLLLWHAKILICCSCSCFCFSFRNEVVIASIYGCLADLSAKNVQFFPDLSFVKTFTIGRHFFRSEYSMENLIISSNAYQKQFCMTKILHYDDSNKAFEIIEFVVLTDCKRKRRKTKCLCARTNSTNKID